jgi:uncharacterized protein YlxP (DUF503 family)
MIVGAAVVEIFVHGSQSLKQKRGVVRSITQRVRNRFNISVSEVGGQGTWQLATLGLVTVGNDARVVRRTLDRACQFIEELHLAEVLSSDVEIMNLPHSEASVPWIEDEAGSDFTERDEDSGD